MAGLNTPLHLNGRQYPLIITLVGILILGVLNNDLHRLGTVDFVSPQVLFVWSSYKFGQED